MSRSRPASNPLSYHKHTGQYYVTRNRKRVYLGSDHNEAIEKYHRLALGLIIPEKPQTQSSLSAKELANRFIATQQANWRNPDVTLSNYRNWLGRFLRDHTGLRAEDLTVEMFAAWKISLKKREYSPESINNYLGAVRAMYLFAEDTELIAGSPKLRRVKNEPISMMRLKDKPIYSSDEIHRLLEHADNQLKVMILLGLNCGFGPKDIQDLTWEDVEDDRVTLPRSKTGICQTFLLWPETLQALGALKEEREERIIRLAKRTRLRSDEGHVFVTKFWRLWGKDALALQFRRLCRKAKVSCYGFYRLRHCASTAVALVTTPHVQRKFMRHSNLQQQVTYTHAPDGEVDAAIMKARARLLSGLWVIGGSGKSRGQAGVA